MNEAYSVQMKNKTMIVTSDFSIELNLRRKWGNIVRILTEKNLTLPMCFFMLLPGDLDHSRQWINIC